MKNNYPKKNLVKISKPVRSCCNRLILSVLLFFSFFLWCGDTLVAQNTVSWTWGAMDPGHGSVTDEAIAVDPSGNVCTAGVDVGNFMVRIAKFNSTGTTLLWSQEFGTSSIRQNLATAITTDATGNVYVVGYTFKTLLASAGAYQTAPVFGTTYGAGFIVKYNASGTKQWFTYLNPGAAGFNSYLNGIAVDVSGNVYVTGFIKNASYDRGFVAELNSAGTALTWLTYMGPTSLRTVPTAIALDAGNNSYITGFTTNTTGISTAGVFQTAGSSDAFVATFSSSGALQAASYYDYQGTHGGTVWGLGIALDNNLNIYITGSVSGAGGFHRDGLYANGEFTASGSLIVASFNNTLTAKNWEDEFVGSSGCIIGFGISVVYQTNSLYVVGATTTPGNPGDIVPLTNPTTFQAIPNNTTGDANPTAAFVMKLSTVDGSQSYGTYYGGDVGNGNAYAGYGIATTYNVSNGSVNFYFAGEATFNAANGDSDLVTLGAVGYPPLTSGGFGGPVAEFTDAPPALTCQQPTVVLTNATSMAVCQGGTSVNLNYSDTANAPDTYTITWDPVLAIPAGFTNVSSTVLDTSSVSLSIVITVPGGAAANTYSGIFIPENSCGDTSQYFISVTVNVLPTPTFTTSPGATSCLNTDVTYTTQIGQSDYSWTIPGTLGTDYNITGGGITTNSVTLQWKTAGSKTVTVNYSTNGCAGASPASSTTTAGDCNPTWVGGNNANDWNTATNWNPNGIPNGCTYNVIIPINGNDPVVNSPVSVGSITITGTGREIITLNSTLSVCGNWTDNGSASSTASGSAVILNGGSAQTLSGNLTFDQLAIANTNGGVSLAIGTTVGINTSLLLQTGNLNTISGTVTLNSASVTQAAIIDNFSAAASPGTGTITGNVTAQRFYAAPTTGNSYNQHEMGSPVNTPALSQFGASGTPGYVTDATCDGTRLDASSPYGTVFGYDETHGAACGVQQWKVLTAGNAVKGKGYSIRNGGPGTLSLTGSPNITGNIGIVGTNSGWTNTTLQGYPEQSGWTLASNPYPATLKISSTSLTNNTAAGWDGVGVMVWNTTGGSAGSYQLTTTLAPFQAFMVHVTEAGTQSSPTAATYTIYAADRVTTANTFYKDVTPNMLNITATNQSTGLYDITNVGFNPDVAAGFDPNFDVHKIAGDVDRHAIYTTSEGNWMYQNVSPSIEQAPTVQMGFAPGVSGTYTLKFDGVNSFDATSYITLEDTKLNVFHDVRTGDYVFTADANDGWNRFVLHFTPPASINTTSATCFEQGMINIVQPGEAIWNYTLADNNNVALSTGVLNANSSVSASVPVGVYTLTLKDNNGYTVVKAVQVSGVQPVVASFTTSANSVNVNQEVTLGSTTAGAVINSWNFGDGTADNGVTVTHSYSAEGVYNVTLNSTSVSGCNSSTTNTITVNRSVTGVTNLNDINGISIWSYENIINVDFSQMKDVQANIEIYNILGQKISEDKYTTSSVYRKEIPNIEAGYVLVSVRNNDAIITKKLFIDNTK